MEWGIKDFWDGMYDYQKYNLEVTKRVFLSQLGFINVLVGGTYYHGSELPFPLLDISTGNQTYWLQKKAYNLMNYMEFVSDKNVYAQFEYHMGGFVLNKIPLIKYLRFREVFSFKMLYGGLTQANDPNFNPNVYKLPLNDNGINTTYTFQNKIPYMEASVGLTNILRVIRVDLLWRLTYLQHPNVAPVGFRVSAHFDF